MAPTAFARAEDAESAFYEALERGDLEALMALWADDEEVVCIPPGGPRLCGHAQIRSAWQALLATTPRLTVRLSRQVRWQGGMIAVHSLLQTFVTENPAFPPGPVQVTNVFIRVAEGWRLLSHHASLGPEDSSAIPPPDDLPRTLH